MFLFAYGSFTLPTRSRITQFGEAESFFDFVNHFARLGGWIGVSSFFAISGFCIHYGYLRGSEGYNFASFMVRRVARIFPAFLVSLIVILSLRIAVGASLGISTWTEFLALATLTFNYFGEIQPLINPAYWTLPIEFQLYLIYGVFLILRRRWGIMRTVIAISVPQVLYYCFKLYAAYELGWKFKILGPWESSPFGYWFAWAIGAYVAERFISGKRAFPQWMLYVSLALFSLALFWHPAVVARYTIGALLCAVIVDRNILVQAKGRIGSGLAWFGKISYSIYLFHMPVLGLFVVTALPNIKEMRDLGMLLVILVFFVVVVPLSWLVYEHVERSGIRFGKKVATRLDTVA